MTVFSKYKKSTFIFWLIVTIIPVLGLLFGVLNPESFSFTQEKIRTWVTIFGIFGPLAFIAIQALQVIVTPINHYAVGLVGGFIYGPYLGGLLNWIGRIIGHISTFFISRLLGRRIADKFVEPKTLEKYDKYISNKSFVLFLIYFLPVFPDDEISYIAGLSKMKFKMFLLANLFGHVGGSLGLAYLGSGLNTKDTLFWILLITTLIGFVVLWSLMKNKTKVNTDSLV